MKSNLLVSPRGQITLPASIRRRMGIQDGGIVTVEEQGGKLVIAPAAVLEVEMYSDEQIKEWLKADEIKANEKIPVFKKNASKKR